MSDNDSELPQQSKPIDLSALLAGMERTEAAWQRLMNVVIGGNAGGLIATLTLLGSIIGLSKTGIAPRALFWTVIPFAIGLAGGVVVRFADLLNELMAYFKVGAGEKFEFDADYARFKKWRLIGSFISIGGLLFGSIFGIIQLWIFTGK